LNSDYTPLQIKKILRNYYNIKSAAQITAQSYDDMKISKSRTNTKEELISTYIDIEKALPKLTRKQKRWVALFMEGYTLEEIASKTNSLKHGVSQGIDRACIRIWKNVNFSPKFDRSS